MNIAYKHLNNVFLYSYRRPIPSLLSSVIYRCASSTVLKPVDISKIRNIGIIAHIDAGKTTTTERMLFYSGASGLLGEVHHGDTVTDYMDQERERGITITSAAVSFNWQKYRFNLIDTPGHVDFTFEVERALRVLDGAVTILDASSGVEAQTMTVWKQAQNYKVPSIIYLNKMDKPLANFDMCLDSIEHKLNVKPLPIHIPLGKGKTFSEIIDLVSMERVIWDPQYHDGSVFFRKAINKDEDSNLWEMMMNKREALINRITDYDDQIVEKIFEKGTMDCVSVQDVYNALRRITLNRKAVPVLVGTSYHNKGVQLVMDSVIRYLPHPRQVQHEFLKYYDPDLCALVFKIIHDKKFGPLAFARIYSGKMEQGLKLYNVTRDSLEKNPVLMMAFSNEFNKVQEVLEGNIAVISGLKDVKTGDTLTSSSGVAKKAMDSYAKDKNKNNAKPVLAGIKVPKTVFFCTIEPPSHAYETKLETALANLQMEDPTFKAQYDENLGQTVIYGMGELHIDVIKKRILDEYKIEAFLGPLQVSYKEQITHEVAREYMINKDINGVKNFVKMKLVIKPAEEIKEKIKVKVVITKENNLGKIYNDHLKAIEDGVNSSLNSGPLLGFPIVGIDASLHWLEVGRGTSIAMITAAASKCLKEAVALGGSQLLEPMMKLEISTNTNFIGRVLSDLSQRRSQILNIDSREDQRIIYALTPLSELINYTSKLRTITSGNVSISMDFYNYHPMNPSDTKKAIERVTGFAP